MSIRLLSGIFLSVVLTVAAHASVAPHECGGVVSGGPKGKILVVEDEPAVSMLIRLILKGMGYEVTIAESVGEAGVHLSANQFDAALVDANLGVNGGDGVALADTLRSKGIVTMLMSGAIDDLPTVDGLSPLAKPFGLGELKKAVGKLFASKKARD